MQNISIKKCISEISELAKITNLLLKNLPDLPDPGDKNYLHFYNLRSLVKKFFDKIYSAQLTPQKKNFSIRININEYESFLFMIDAIPILGIHPYTTSTILSFCADCDRERIRLISPGSLLS
jgi:hypothetical protein